MKIKILIKNAYIFSVIELISPVSLRPFLFNRIFFHPIPLDRPIWQLSLRLRVVWSLTKKNSALKFVTMDFEVTFLYLFQKYHAISSFHHLEQALQWVVCQWCSFHMNPKQLEEKSLRGNSSTFLAIRTFFHSHFFPQPFQISLNWK